MENFTLEICVDSVESAINAAELHLRKAFLKKSEKMSVFR